MSIQPKHIHLFEEIFNLPGILSEPVLIFGYQEIRIPDLFFKNWTELSLKEKFQKLKLKITNFFDFLSGKSVLVKKIPPDYNYTNIIDFLRSKNIEKAESLDLYDERASLKYDLNYPLPADQFDKYSTFLDIGSIEHVFDTRQCLESCLKTVKLGGHYILHVPVNGYFAHGLHVFNPNMFFSALELNGFEIIYKKYSLASGKVIKDPSQSGDVLMWLVAKKIRNVSKFIPPQQDYWDSYYKEEATDKRNAIQEGYWDNVG